MSLDLILVSAILKSNQYKEYKTKITSRDFWEDPRAYPIWTFIEEYQKEYGLLPDLSTIQAKFDVEIPEPIEVTEFYFKELEDRLIFTRLNNAAIETEKDLKANSPRKALFGLRDTVTETVKILNTSSPITPFVSMTGVVWDEYLKAKAGDMGIPTPWASMNEWTHGFFPKDLSFVVGRTGLGKSWMLLLLAKKARAVGHKTQIISCEMSKEDMARRFFSIENNIPYGAMRKGKLSLMDESRFKEALDNYRPEVDIEIQDGSQGLQITDIETAIMRTDCDFILIDSVYRIRARQKVRDRMENMAMVIDDIKLFSQMYNKAIICSTQLNRSSTQKKNEDISTEDIALSDVIGWNSTNIFAIQPEKKVADDDGPAVMKITPVKVRENSNGGKPMYITWDFTTMGFDEVDTPIQKEKRAYSRTDKGDDDDDVSYRRW